MHFRIIVIDLDGTIAKEGKCSSETRETLEEAEAIGFFIRWVTGRFRKVIHALATSFTELEIPPYKINTFGNAINDRFPCDPAKLALATVQAI